MLAKNSIKAYLDYYTGIGDKKTFNVYTFKDN